MNYKVTIIETPGINGMNNLALEYSPAILSQQNGAAITREDLVHRIYVNPLTDREIKYNRVMLEKVASIKQYRMGQIKRGEIKLYDLDGSRDFVSFYRKVAMERKGSSTNYTAGFVVFENYVKGKCSFKDVGKSLFVSYREYLRAGPLTQNVRSSEPKVISYSTAKGYFDQFRFILREAFQKGYLEEDFHDCEEALHEVAVERHYISDDDLSRLRNTVCRSEDVPRICRFILLTGLRYSDVMKIRWEHVFTGESGRTCFRRIIQRTHREELFYLSETALNALGKPKKRGAVFTESVKGQHSRALQKWITDAGIQTYITFDSFRRNLIGPSNLPPALSNQ